MKRCSKCRVEKAIVEFSKQAAGKDGLQARCKQCSSASYSVYYAANSVQLRQRAEEHRKKIGPMACRAIALKSTYGISESELLKLDEAQSGRCAICKDKFLNSRATHVDHVHGSDPVIIRGLLCRVCNIGLGHFKDSPERLLNAVEYLKKFQKIA